MTKDLRILFEYLLLVFILAFAMHNLRGCSEIAHKEDTKAACLRVHTVIECKELN